MQAAAWLTAVEVVGDTSAKLDGELAVYASYNALAYSLPRVLRHNPLGLTNGYWNAMTNITHLVIGRALGEELESIQVFGILLSTAGILCMAQGKQTL